MADATELGVHVMYTQQILDWINLPSRQQRWKQPDGCRHGSWGAELMSIPSPALPSCQAPAPTAGRAKPSSSELEKRDVDKAHQVKS